MSIEDFSQINPDLVLTVIVGLILLTVFLVFILPAILGQDKIKFSFVNSARVISKNFALSATLVVILVAIFGTGYFYYQLTRPTVILAADFKVKEQASLDDLKHSSNMNRYEAQIFLIDTRTQKDFLDSHLFGSFNVPAEFSESQDVEPFRDKKVAVYSSKDKYDEGYTVAKYIKDQKVAKKVYIISDGFEGLTEVGLETETGLSD